MHQYISVASEPDQGFAGLCISGDHDRTIRRVEPVSKRGNDRRMINESAGNPILRISAILKLHFRVVTLRSPNRRRDANM